MSEEVPDKIWISGANGSVAYHTTECYLVRNSDRMTVKTDKGVIQGLIAHKKTCEVCKERDE